MIWVFQKYSLTLNKNWFETWLVENIVLSSDGTSKPLICELGQHKRYTGNLLKNWKVQQNLKKVEQEKQQL